MSDNPYASPQSSVTAVGVLSGQREDLRSVAKYQRGVIMCILAQILLYIALLAFAKSLLALLAALGMLCVWIAGAVFVFLLAIKVYGQGLGIVLGILTFVPCIGLIVLLIVNGKATSVLKSNGIGVGFLGANVSSI